jgi:hypothetical protein
MNACASSVLPCPGQKEQSSDCCKSKHSDQSSDQNQNDQDCCQSTISQIPYQIDITTHVPADLGVKRSKVFIPIFRQSYDFHEDVWQPPKYS